MADISQIKLPNGDIFDLVDESKSTATNWVNGSSTGSVRTINSAAEDSSYTIGQYAVAEGQSTKATGKYSHAEGGGTTASGTGSHAEGAGTQAKGANSHAEGGGAIANGNQSHAEGSGTTAGGPDSHAEGNYTTASGDASHAEGGGTQASGQYSHAEGASTIASNNKDHAEGYQTTASGGCAHAEGYGTVASGLDSHAEGDSTIANHLAQHVFGQYNIADASTATADNKGKYVEIVGNGSYNARSNARTLDWSGNEVLAGKLTVGVAGTNSLDVATIGQLPTKVSDLTNDSGFITGYTETDPTVPSWAKESTKPTYTASEVGAIPISRTINGKALSDNITLDADDVSAIPTSAKGTASGVAPLDANSKVDSQYLPSYLIKGNTGGIFYGTCSTAAGTVAKVVECADFTADNLKAGAIIIVSFTATNSGAVANLTMNVNGTGAKHIKYINNGTLGNLPSAGYLKANTEYPFYYDGANWVCWFNMNSTYSALSEADMHTGTATAGRLITAQRLKQAVRYHAPVTSVNGSTGAVTINVPTNYDAGLVKAWYYHSAAATGFTTGSDENAITVNSRTTTEGRYYGVETDTDGLMFVNVPWTSSATNWVNGSAANSVRTVGSKVESSSYTIGNYAVAEGYQTEAGGNGSHAEGWQAKASGQDAHAEGASTIASGWHSHAEGYGTIANHNAQHVFGKFNRAESSAPSTSSLGNYVEIVGNGESNLVRSNARTLDWEGNEWLAGSLTLGSTTLTEADIIALHTPAEGGTY